ncbi:putative SAM and PH domain protein [Aspergillus avenaceus]|uniref:Putative SAM and PH domain protein n=1 Tax=Aspergillus avenaceus TaxID=36643 RepID=A0A5N6TWK8_ASPAV|nr:putative SAM and PH domain protein [Aspergillus avenaceus]
MAIMDAFHSSRKIRQAQDRMPLYPSKVARTRPRSVSDTTDILDTDLDSDSLEGYSDEYSRKSDRSHGTESITTVSTPDDEVRTPDSTGLTAFHFHIDESPVKGPVGPHLFRLSGEFTDPTSPLGVELFVEDSPISETIPVYSAPKLERGMKETKFQHTSSEQNQVEAQPRTVENISCPASDPSESEVTTWTPEDVVMYMQKQGFDDSVVEKFFINDISGSILLELQSDDLKELDIQSFGKRHRIMGCIKHLRNGASMSSCDSESSLDPTSREDTATPQTTAAEVGVECTSPMTDDEKPRPRSGQRRRRHRHKHRNGKDIIPEDSVSIVAIEQLLPRLHTCSKGENCRKWQKQHAKLTRLAKDIPIECLGGSVNIVVEPNGTIVQTPAKTPKSDVTPSLIASSDALGQAQNPDVKLSQERLNTVRPRDPQENVRNFLNFQRLSRLQPVTDPATPPKEHFPSPCSDSPGSPKGTLSENLRHLPKLRIPSTHSDLTASTLSPNYSAQRTITPSILGKRQPFTQSNAQKYLSVYSSEPSPSDFYRQDPHYGQTTPYSDVDIPITAIPLGPVARMCSQSVPPNMRFGGHHTEREVDPIPRPMSTKVENNRRNALLLNPYTFHPLNPVEERSPLPPIETPEDMDRTPRAAHCKNNPFTAGADEIIRSGWMKKKKTTRLLRHEWQDHHFALRGTRLGMYTDEDNAHQNSKALEYIDVDDYAVACSSLPSNSKLTAAFKKTVLKRRSDGLGEAAFAFSLIPSPTSGSFDRKSIFANGPKPHHFAVKTRDERIDWMRELMLAKALRRGRESGASLNINGAAF